MAPVHVFVGGCIFALIALAMKIVGLITTSWLFDNNSFNVDKISMGLFEYCFIGVCHSIDNPTSSLKAVRALEIIGAAGTFVGLVLAIVSLVLLRREVTTIPIHSLAFSSQSLAGLCSTIGVVVFRFDTFEKVYTNKYDSSLYSYGYSFYLSMLGGTIAMLGGAIVSYAGRQMIAARMPPSYSNNPMKKFTNPNIEINK